ncbi:hypothetical protein [Streptomyces rubradiris]|uniref:Chromosome partition protein Smc n=1 Tax=Streptomyces rubradiris TaxID=285531 RepID=A0ABQ3R3C4_STRRR|nr:hypothetical protein [Streptomyces rubradiris]GHH29946.1 hypothetical protein GCM10018792_75710 [Streptomyces rubradiris]GHI50352.1 hypothetical protein Srubr_01980 [Streptomyces rubradiris]
MNTRSVNSAAGVILAAMQQKQTATGIALALESAGLLMSPESATDLQGRLDEAHEELTGVSLSLYEEELETARLRLALKSAQRGRREMRSQRDEFCDRVDTLTAVAKGNKRHVADLTAECQRLQTELVAARERYREGLRKADEQVNAMSAEVKRYAAGDESPVLWSVYNKMHGRALSSEAEAEGLRARVAELEAERHATNEALSEAAESLREHRDRIAELEKERARYVGAEPTIAEELTYLSRCLDAVLDLCEKAEKQATRWENPLPMPEWVAEVRAAAEGMVERTSYPPAMPWARLMDDEDLAEFLDGLVGALETGGARDALAEVEDTCATWRAIAEAQHAHNTAPGPGEETAR